ncbi:hypothetical protein BCR33DRAFT_734799 [Rhizoclosmatium globosum]|uniref:Uncharacterized protein n=1 Tax=Rhizoclosmatium globosum TaxID=329046 RepID=A0A1Y2CT04_9FUNG|nr:hypothetical protein BCR33DRAFT_734799 [Rhizoclosmatium globosum]|eukprot:ORY50087.1 hypothetical protein BCR33DRAFT_734799 [Rhizoclosmatium globosum]
MHGHIDETDYSAIQKTGTTVCTQVAYNQYTEMLKETENNLNTTTVPEPTVHLSTLETHLRTTVLKHYKLATKKKSPQSAWKPVFSALESITLYIQKNQSWITQQQQPTDDAEFQKRAVAVFSAFGVAWCDVAEVLMEAGVFNEQTYPSVRDWPAKLEAIYTQTVYAGNKSQKKKAVVNSGDDDVPNKKKEKKKKDEEEGEDEDDKKKKKHHHHHHHHHHHAHGKPEEEHQIDPWDFEDLMELLRVDPKHVQEPTDTTALQTEEMRQKLAVAAL